MISYQNRAILHLDGDAFFASVEQVKNWRLKGKPVVTGGERFIAASMSYEAKAKGVTRGMMVADIRKLCPDAIIVPSDYVTYTIFARRLYEIVRTFTPIVEEYSIDECFADITGLDEEFGMSYEEIGKKIKNELESKLGLTFGVGLASSKVLAKVASKHRKPAGFTYIKNESNIRKEFLKNLGIEKVWGIGASTTKLLRAHGILTALDFSELSSHQLSALNVAKPYREIHTELNGLSVLPVSVSKREMPKSIMSSRTFVPSSRIEDTVFSHLSKNIEEACERLRHVEARAKACSFYIKSQEFRYYGSEYIFDTPTDDPLVVVAAARGVFGKLFKRHIDFRATGISLRSLVPAESRRTLSLFDENLMSNMIGNMDDAVSNICNKSTGKNSNCNLKALRTETGREVNKKVDKINKKFGDHTIMLGSSMQAVAYYDQKRKSHRIKSDKLQDNGQLQTKWHNQKIWAIPFLGVAR